MKEIIEPLITEQRYSNQACDRFLVNLDGWAGIGETMRWPYRSVPLEYADHIRPDVQKLNPEFFEVSISFEALSKLLFCIWPVNHAFFCFSKYILMPFRRFNLFLIFNEVLPNCMHKLQFFFSGKIFYVDGCLQNN